jgi:hypothetical protein
MADTTTSGETATGAITGAELIRIVQSGNMRKSAAELIGHQFRGARAVRTTNQTTANYTTGTPIPFESADVDTDTFWSAGSPSRLTIPAGLGITHVDVSAAVRVELVTSDTWTELAIVQRNSADAALGQWGNMSNILTTTTKKLSAGSLCVPVSDGDYFTAVLTQQTDTSITVVGSIAQTSLALRVTGMEP